MAKALEAAASSAAKALQSLELMPKKQRHQCSAADLSQTRACSMHPCTLDRLHLRHIPYKPPDQMAKRRVRPSCQAGRWLSQCLQRKNIPTRNHRTQQTLERRDLSEAAPWRSHLGWHRSAPTRCRSCAPRRDSSGAIRIMYYLGVQRCDRHSTGAACSGART